MRVKHAMQVSGIKAQYDKMVADMIRQQSALKSKQVELQKRLKAADVRPVSFAVVSMPVTSYVCTRHYTALMRNMRRRYYILPCLYDLLHGIHEVCLLPGLAVSPACAPLLHKRACLLGATSRKQTQPTRNIAQWLTSGSQTCLFVLRQIQ
jgi:hypothetical protein